MRLDDEQAVMKKYERLAHNVSKRYNGNVESDDVVQYARMGILKAIRTYDPSKETEFMTHAYTCAFNSIRHNTRKDTGVVHIPYKRIVDGRTDNPVRVDMPTDNDHLTEYISFDGSADIKVVLGDVLAKLPETERFIVEQMHLKGCTAEEVAACLNMSVSKVYKEAKKALTSMKNTLEKRGYNISDLITV
jgi:RNA polymerase sigma factor (sigma-70 family)